MSALWLFRKRKSETSTEAESGLHGCRSRKETDAGGIHESGTRLGWMPGRSRKTVVKDAGGIHESGTRLVWMPGRSRKAVVKDAGGIHESGTRLAWMPTGERKTYRK